MSNVVFILGAGASAQGGAPVMANFIDVARDLLNSGGVDDSRDDFRRVFKAIGHLQRVHSKAQLDIHNIESVLTAIELGKLINRVPGLTTDEIDATITSIKVMIVKTLESSLTFGEGGSSLEAPVPYPDFARLLSEMVSDHGRTVTVSVITFNYDLALDVSMYRVGLGINYVVDEEANHAPGTLELMKLHGSLNWAVGQGRSVLLL